MKTLWIITLLLFATLHANANVDSSSDENLKLECFNVEIFVSPGYTFYKPSKVVIDDIDFIQGSRAYSLSHVKRITIHEKESINFSQLPSKLLFMDSFMVINNQRFIIQYDSEGQSRGIFQPNENLLDSLINLAIQAYSIENYFSIDSLSEMYRNMFPKYEIIGLALDKDFLYAFIYLTTPAKTDNNTRIAKSAAILKLDGNLSFLDVFFIEANDYKIDKLHVFPRFGFQVSNNKLYLSYHKYDDVIEPYAGILKLEGNQFMLSQMMKLSMPAFKNDSAFKDIILQTPFTITRENRRSAYYTATGDKIINLKKPSSYITGNKDIEKILLVQDIFATSGGFLCLYAGFNDLTSIGHKVDYYSVAYTGFDNKDRLYHQFEPGEKYSAIFFKNDLIYIIGENQDEVFIDVFTLFDN